MQLTSPCFGSGDSIPRDYTCDGSETSPPLQWFDLPAQTRSLALIVEDPDAPDPAHPRRTFAHWLVYNLPPNDRGLNEGAADGGLPVGARLGINDFGDVGYDGPCPPTGEHRYVHRLFALDAVLPDLGEPDRDALLEAIRGHVLAEAELVATYRGH